MLYRIMTNDKITDFVKESDATAFFTAQKVLVEKSEIKVDEKGIKIIPTVSMHKCYHDEKPFRPCVMIEKVEAIEKVEVKDK
jgi:hypothetical protein